MRDRKILMLVESALAVALALAVNKLGIEMPQGGSINFEMIPILFIALRWGFKAGLLAGTASGVLQLFISAHIYYPVQAILDYPIAFAVLGLAGLVKVRVDAYGTLSRKKDYSGLWQRFYIIIGILLGTLTRTLMHVLSGVIFFAEYSPAGQNVWLYSAVYNLTYMLPSILLNVIVLLLVLPIFQKALDREEKQKIA